MSGLKSALEKIQSHRQRLAVRTELQNRIFKLLLDAYGHRLKQGDTTEAIAERAGYSVDDFHKILSSAEFDLLILANLQYALGVDLEFALVSKANPNLRFTDTGKAENDNG